MTAAKVMDVIARLLACARQAANAVSAHTQVTVEDAPKLHRSPNHGHPVVLLERNFAPTSTRWTLLWDRRLEVVLLGLGW